MPLTCFGPRRALAGAAQEAARGELGRSDSTRLPASVRPSVTAAIAASHCQSLPDLPCHSSKSSPKSSSIMSTSALGALVASSMIFLISSGSCDASEQHSDCHTCYSGSCQGDGQRGDMRSRGDIDGACRTCRRRGMCWRPALRYTAPRPRRPRPSPACPLGRRPHPRTLCSSSCAGER